MFNFRTHNLKLRKILSDNIDYDTAQCYDSCAVAGTVDLMIEAGDDNIGISEGTIGLNVVHNNIEFVDIEADGDEVASLGDLHLFAPGSLYKIKKYLQAYLLTNRDVLDEDVIQELEELIEEVELWTKSLIKTNTTV